MSTYVSNNELEWLNDIGCTSPADHINEVPHLVHVEFEAHQGDDGTNASEKINWYHASGWQFNRVHDAIRFMQFLKICGDNYTVIIELQKKKLESAIWLSQGRLSLSEYDEIVADLNEELGRALEETGAFT